MVRAIVAGIVVVMAAASAWFVFEWQRERTVSQAFGAPFQLVDHNGDQITEAAFRGSPSVLFFGFTHCPEVCPTTLFELDGWLDQLGAEGEAINAYFVSVDPERDTPEILGTYVGNVSDRVTGITGDPEKVAEMAKAYAIYVKRIELEGGDYTMDHTASILMLNAQGDFVGTIAYGENPDTAVVKLQRLANGA